MRKRVSLTLYLAMMAWLAMVPAAQAYIDPGSGSIIFQAVVAGLAAAGTALAVFWSKITRLFRRGASEDALARAAEDEPTVDSADR